MGVTTFTTTAAEDARLTAWATASGFPNAKAMVIALVKTGLQQFEASQSQQTFAAGYAPINPT